MNLPILLGACLLVGLAGCSKNASAYQNPNAPSNTTSPNTDQDLAERVRRAVTDDAMVATLSQDLQVTALNGVVTLRGGVRSQSDKDAIGNKARGVSGVASVVNELSVRS